MSIIHRWAKQHTTGTPPPGVRGYGSCSSGTDMYYFGGYCVHNSCFHNSLFHLSTATLVWDELVPTTEHIRPMPKAYGALLAFDDQLLAFGGRSITDPSHPSPLAKYKKFLGWVYTNEHHLFDQKRGEGHSVNTLAMNYCRNFRRGVLFFCFRFYLSLSMVSPLMADILMKFH